MTIPTITDDRPTAEIEHPAWCYPAWCTVHRVDAVGHLLGEHMRLVRTVPKCEGNVVHILLCQDVYDGDEVQIALVEPLAEDDAVPDGEVDNSDTRLRFGAQWRLEPEEARMLGRFLAIAADEWQRVQP
jgi:hypothetical protein